MKPSFFASLLGAALLVLATDASAQPVARVHVRSDVPVTLEAREPPGDWTAACASPCDRDVPLDREYRLAGHGVHASEPIELTARPGGRVRLDVEAGSRVGYGIGIAMQIVGLTAATVGAVLVFLSRFTLEGPPDTGQQVAMVGMLAGGVGLLIGGTIVRTNNRTDVAQTPVAARAPVWREKSAMEAAAPRGPAVPLVALSF